MESYSFKFTYSNGKNGAANGGSVEIFRYIISIIICVGNGLMRVCVYVCVCVCVCVCV